MVLKRLRIGWLCKNSLDSDVKQFLIFLSFVYISDSGLPNVTASDQLKLTLASDRYGTFYEATSAFPGWFAQLPQSCQQQNLVPEI